MPVAAVDGLNLYMEVHGSGAPLLLINGMDISSCGPWHRFQVPALAAEYRVVLYDQRGTGRSALHPAGDLYSTRDLAREAVGVLDAAGIAEPAHVVGISMGGRIAQWFALDYPDRLRALVLASTGPGQYQPDFEPTRGIPLHVAEGLIEMGYEGYIRHHLRSEMFFPPEIAAARPGLVEWAVSAFLEHMMPLQTYLRHTIARQRHQTCERLGEVRAPTLVICGERDTAVLSTGNHVQSSRALAERIPGAALHIVRGAAHSVFWQEPDETNAAVLDFLRRH